MLKFSELTEILSEVVNILVAPIIVFHTLDLNVVGRRLPYATSPPRRNSKTYHGHQGDSGYNQFSHACTSCSGEAGNRCHVAGQRYAVLVGDDGHGPVFLRRILVGVYPSSSGYSSGKISLVLASLLASLRFRTRLTAFPLRFFTKTPIFREFSALTPKNSCRQHVYTLSPPSTSPPRPWPSPCSRRPGYHARTCRARSVASSRQRWHQSTGR